MIEQKIKMSTCRVSCGDESGTGWLIAERIVITARHCVLGCLTDGKPVELFFPAGSDVAVPSQIVAQSEEYDACLLSLESDTGAEALPVCLERPREGETWQTFGYPQGKQIIGHRVTGAVAQVLNIPKLKIDLDLSVEPTVALRVYQGLSGAAVVCEGAAVGMIRLKVDGTVAALSLHQLESFLSENGVTLSSDSSAPTAPVLADRGAFAQDFTEAIYARSGSYLFLEGAHGYGKSTFCTSYRSDDKKLINLGAYCLSDPDSALGADYRAQPQVLIDWLATRIAGLITGQAPRKEEKSYNEQIRQTAYYLDEFSKYCAQSGRQGMFFIDGLNEIPAGPLLGGLLGLLPSKLPAQVIVVLTAPNFTSIAGALAGKVKAKDVFVLPPLPDSACYSYCEQTLKPERRSPALVDRICEKAKGHPLYLRYLIEYVNHQATDDALDDFPVMTGPIEEYYHGIWARLLPDEVAVHLLALMARLRWGLAQADFAKALNPPEQAQFVSVISRIRHLLAEDDHTAIYHSSFAVFVIEQTAGIDQLAYRQLAEFCFKEPGLRYCGLNRIFHLLRAGDNSVFANCNQDWFDTAVTLGVEPDALIADVDAVVKHAAMEASVDEFFRLTLLAQRISFRYNTLFAQSARLIAEALINLGRPQEALQHVLRIKTLIVGPDDALQIGFLLHRHGFDDEALMLLDRIQQRITESYGERMELRSFIGLCSLHIQAILLIRLARGWSGMEQVMAVMDIARNACEQAAKDAPSEPPPRPYSAVSRSTAYFISFQDDYAELSRIKPHLPGTLSEVLPTLCIALLQFEHTVDSYHLPKARKSLAKLFADLAELVSNAKLDSQFVGVVTDSLVRFGAPADIVEAFGIKGGKQPVRPLQIKAKNGVDVNHGDLQECLSLWRVAAFLDSEFRCPASGVFLSTDWLDALERLIGALYWCDGRARRARADGDETARLVCRDQLKSQVLDQLRFTLQRRAYWRDSYAIPETALPGVYRQVAELLSDCFPEFLPEWLDNLVVDADGQWGMYSEGFRESAFHIIQQLTREKPADDIAPRLLQLLHAWRDHVLRGVENRHELVPEILRIIPFFAYLGANEEADRLYRHLLAVSMGPTWYKEDQLGLMTDVLRNVAPDQEVWHRLPQIAGYLERAAGEMTFQRYVRQEKASLLGQIARQGRFRAAVAYFRRQCCGSTEELWAEAQQGPIDKIGPLQGNRFPGGALDDQAAALELVQNSGLAQWPLRWALLEIFHCGDSRHLTDYGEAFAKIANEAGPLPELIRRATIVANAETPPDERISFTSAFRKALNPELHADFKAVLADLPPLAPPKPKVRQEINEDDDAYRGFFNPGVIGTQNSIRAADKVLEEVERQRTLGNHLVAKAKAIELLQTVQEGGWDIWGNLSDSARRAEEILAEREANAAGIIRHYAPLLDAERYVPKWMSARHLIGKVGPLLTGSEGHLLIDAVIDHVRLMVGDATREIKTFAFLSDDAPEQSPSIELFQFIVWLCDHPQSLRRDRAAAMLLWLIDYVPELFSIAVDIALSMHEGCGPDVLCGVLDVASANKAVALWDKVRDAADLGKVTQELRHVSRMAVLLRLATRAAAAGSSSAKIAMGQIQSSFIGRRQTSVNTKMPLWASCLAPEWHQLSHLVDADAVATWEKELRLLCAPLSIADAQTLEQAVSASFRENHERPLNRWESKLRYTLNLALRSRVSVGEASSIEAVLRIYNPSQPEKAVQAMSNPVTDQLIAAIKSGDYSAVLGASATVLLNYHDTAVKTTNNGADYVEVLCVLQPTSQQRGFFAPKLEQLFRSSELPVPRMATTPFETCCRLSPKVVFFGAFTPAVPFPFFQRIVGAKDEDFVRINWRYGRRNGVRGFGQANREGCSLSVARKALKVPREFKLAWIVRLNGEIVAFVDEHNNPLN